MNSIAFDVENEKRFSSRIQKFFRRYQISGILKKCNAYKEQGFSVVTLIQYLFCLVFRNRSMFLDSEADMVNSGYSDCTVKITYQAKVNSDDSVVFGDAGNPNEVVLLWRRTSSSYYDTLVDDAHLFTYGVELTKKFSDGQGDFDNVEFILHNDTDDYYIIAELNEDEGIYYVTGHTKNESEATHLIPVKDENGTGKVFVKGLEDDQYTATEVRTDDGYTLLRDDIQIVISQVETVKVCDIYASDVLGLIQNDPRYASIINDTGNLHNMPQKQLEHHLLTASATVDGKDVSMLEDDDSANAHATLTVVNTRGFDLPSTGDRGVWMYGLAGVLLMSASTVTIFFACRKKKHAEEFAGVDKDGTIRHIHKRSTAAQGSYKGNAPGSEPEYSFHWHGGGDTLYLFEAPIDLLSYITLHPRCWRSQSYAAACGVSDKVLWQMLQDYPHIQRVCVCFDSDEPGQQAAQRIAKELTEQNIPNELLISEKKDWNEQLLCMREEVT